MTPTAPLRRPSTRLCPFCNHKRPIGQFSEQVSLDKDPQRWRRIEHDACRVCRTSRCGQAAPGRAMQ
ncbi:MAG: hypothetical protein ACOC0M_00175 [Halomonas sp.]